MSRFAFACIFAFLAVSLLAQAQVDYRNFRNTTGLNLIGETKVLGTAIRMVPSRRDTRGNVWTQKAFPVAQGFHATFSFRYSHQGGSRDGNGNPGNDGLLFYIQPVSNTLQQNVEVPPKSLMIFFDGYKNYDKGEVSSSRVEVQVNAHCLGQSDVEPLGIRYRDAKIIHAQIEYDGDRLSVILNEKLVVSYENVDLQAISPGYVGFHAMGGDAYADVDLLNLHFDPRSPSISPAKREVSSARCRPAAVFHL